MDKEEARVKFPKQELYLSSFGPFLVLYLQMKQN